MSKTMTAFSVAAALLMTPGAATAQQSLAADSDFVWVFEVLDDIVFMVQAPPLTATPSQPIDVWVWTFYREPEDMPFFGNRDSMAARTRVDCQAGTTEALRYEAFLGGSFIRGFRPARGANAANPETASAEIIRAACEPGYSAGARTFADLASARAAAQAHFNGRPD